MAKIKFMPIQNPIDKLYTDVTGMPFPVSAAVTGGGPQPEPELEFGTINMELLDPVYYVLGAVTMTANQGMTDKEVYVTSGGDNQYFTVRMIPSESNAKLLVLDENYENVFSDGACCYPNGDAATYIQPDEAEGPSTNYHVDYNWGTAVIEYLENGRYGGGIPEFRITLDAELSEWAMNQIEEAVGQGGHLDFGAYPEVHLNADYTVINFEQGEDQATLVDNHFHGVAYAMAEDLQTLCENWDSMNPTDLLCTQTIDVADKDWQYPLAQVGIGFRATFGSYVPDCH